MRTSKRLLAGVAAGALALGALTIASAPAASAKPSIKPKASLTGTVSPVRVTFTGSPSTSTLNTVPFASLSWTSSAVLAATDTIDVQLTVAPSSSAVLGIAIPSNIGTSTGTISGSAFANAFANETLSSGITDTPLTNGAVTSVGGTARIGLAASQAGTYAGTITSNSSTCAAATSGQPNVTGGGVCDVVSFSFTTTGAPASMTLTPASQSVTQSGVTTLTATLRDAAGNVTQPVLADVVSVAAPGATSVSPTSISMVSTSYSATSGASSNSLWDGTATITYTAAATTGTYTVTATPAGTLPAGGVTTQNATVSVAGSAPATSAISTIAVSLPANAANDPNGTDVQPTAATALVPAGTASVTLTFTGAASTTYRFGAYALTGTGTINGATAVADSSKPSNSAANVNATTNSSGIGTVTYTLGGALVAAGNAIKVYQVNASNNTGAITGGGVITVTQAIPAVSGALSTTTPSGSIVQALGTPTPVTVNIVDQFGDPIPNATVAAYRGSTSGTLLSSGVTNASGDAKVTVSNLSSLAVGGSETYVFTATPLGAASAVSLTGGLTILYTASGAVTSMAVTVAGGATSPILNTTTSIASLPYLYVPYTGIVTGPSSTAYISTTTGAVTNIGGVSNFATFTAAPSPANMVTVTVPTGAKVSSTAPSTTTLWSGGAQSVVVASSQPVYVWATKTGTIDVTFTSGAITTTAKVQVATPPAAAYNIAVSPTSRTIEANAFSSVTLTVSDVFGNPIPSVSSTSGSAGAVSAVASGEVLLGGVTASATFGTGSSGTATVALIAGKPGTGKVTFAPSSGAANAAAAWQNGYVKPVGAPDPIKSAEVAVVVTAKEARSIVVTGSGRTTVGGKPGVYADGDTDGFADGAKLNVWVRFPGQTSYTKGSGTPTVDKSGAFSWERKTGKKTYVYFTSSDDAISSNTVIIPAN